MTDPTQPPERPTNPRKDRTMFSPDTLRTLDALGFPLESPERPATRDETRDDAETGDDADPVG